MRKKASQSGSRSRKRTISPPPSSRPRKKTTSPAQTGNAVDPSRLKISYENNGRTDLIIDWLVNNVDDRIRLFSDNVQDASAEGRPIRNSKTSKIVYYRKIAKAVFENDTEQQFNYRLDPEKYAKSVENHIRGYVLTGFAGALTESFLGSNISIASSIGN
jgi:hypothetical protein